MSLLIQNRPWRLSLGALALLALIGCGVESASSEKFSDVNGYLGDGEEMRGGVEGSFEGIDASRFGAVDAAEAAAQPGEETLNDSSPTNNVDRPAAKPKIIYTADLTVVVDDFAAAEMAIPKLIEEFGGYIAQSNVDRSSGFRLRGTWTVRIPVSSYEAFLAGADGLGVVEERDETAKDVTAEFVDTEARLAGRRALETRLLELLAERPGELKDVLDLERELARVREEIETAEGRLRYLSNQVSFSTVTLNVREERDYEPPKAPTFGSRIATTWDNSLEALASFGRGLVLFAVAVAPFAVIFGLPIVLFFWWLIRRLRRK
ncbi:MAG: DUF4349 domain-containing protein [Planctomycetota bacterium]